MFGLFLTRSQSVRAKKRKKKEQKRKSEEKQKKRKEKKEEKRKTFRLSAQREKKRLSRKKRKRFAFGVVFAGRCSSDRAEVQKKKRDYALLLQEYKETAASVVAVNQHCEGEKAKLVQQVRVTKEHQEEQKGLIKRCQGEEAACQVLQRNLSSCHPGLTISIP